MEWNAETVLDALNDFERKPEINPILEEYLERIAKNGEIIFPWSKLKPLLKKKLEIVLDVFYETYPVETSVPVPNFETFDFDNLKKSILHAVDAFTSAPFTIQRLCELVTNPQKHYNRTDKYMRGIEKNVLVVSTIEPRIGMPADGNNANNNVIVNGMINDSPRDDNDALNGHETESSDNVSSSNLNTPSNHVLLENFANVFPSAVCIPSASNICITREIDNNFISSSECVESQEEVDFEASSEQSTENVVECKEEVMDMTEEESVTDSVSNNEVAAENLESPELQESNTSEIQLSVCVSTDPTSNVSEMDSTVVVKDEENGTTSSAAPVDALSVIEEAVKSDEHCQQDDTVSQSDDTTGDGSEINRIICEGDLEVSENVVTCEDNFPETDTVASKNEVTCEFESVTKPNESSEQCMELESEKCTDITSD